MRHSWAGYVKFAWGFDELMPLTQTGKNSFGELGATIVDSLDTLWLLGLDTEFQAARDWVINDLSFDKCDANPRPLNPDAPALTPDYLIEVDVSSA